MTTRFAERDAAILELLKTKSMGAVAAELGVSRNVVAGVMHRNGKTTADLRGSAQRVSKPATKAAVVQERPEPEADVFAGVATALNVAPELVGADTRRSPFDFSRLDLSAAARAVIEAERGTCRFVLGEFDRSDMRFCGAPATVLAGKALTYCRDCARLVYGRSAEPAVTHPVSRTRADRHFIGG